MLFIKAMIHKTVTLLGAEVHYWIHNPDQKEVLIAVHGFRGNHEALTDFADAIKTGK
jgi:hypothetical protein